MKKIYVFINNDVNPIQNFVIKKIQKDGNCFYRTVSYYFRETEEIIKNSGNLLLNISQIMQRNIFILHLMKM